ncbi:phytanoyl-CoA dioxygenase family protein [Cobetia crustatorum]|uniref:Phytanoyl-CoA dioxygenase family protein n=2 Tax=Cobetia crustatorum TaxID=553385 RepID=A0A558HQ97_9GAMM|nr:phytanoyl-CoA dioxygenase family protein [Cobetia crustatorum]
MISRNTNVMIPSEAVINISSVLASLLKAPLWGLALFTGAKSFIANPLIGSERLNRRGLHVWRVKAASRVMRWRMAMLSRGVPAAEREAYLRDGFLLKQDFLTPEVFAKLRAELESVHEHGPGEVRECCQGDTRTHRVLLDPETLSQLPTARQVLAAGQLQRLLRFCAGHRRLPIVHLEKVFNGARESDEADPQKSLHVDTFQPTMKFWLYLDDVSEHNGPFMFVSQSTQLSKGRLDWEYHMSLTAREHANRYTQRGSFRVEEGALERFGLNFPTLFKVPANTLLIADTFGMHGRGPARAGSSRLALWGMSRTTPFLPLPGLGGEWLNRLQYRVLKAERARDDKRAAARGVESSWHVVPRESLREQDMT